MVDLHPQKAMSGMSYGAPAVARVISMRASTNIRKSIIFLKVMRSHVRIGFASI